MLRAIVVAILLSSRAFAGDGDATSGATLSVVQGYAFVSVRINGNGPFRMLIDTGASSCSLTTEAASRADLKYDHRVSLSVLGGDRTVPAASNGLIRLGVVEESGVEILAMDLEGVRQIDKGSDGVLGESFLNRRPYLMDYSQRKLWLGSEAVARSKLLPIELHGSQILGRMVVPVVLKAGTKPWRLAIDSGASSLLIQCSRACPAISGSRLRRVITNTGERTVRQGTLSYLELGRAAVAGGVAVLVEEPPKAGREDGLLPARWFSAVYVDCGEDLVRLANWTF
jgi:hypothetical protein